jgi:predicted DsbA family dithiol-disulfide isomerase
VPLESAQNVSPDAEKEFKQIAVSLAKDTKLDAAALEECVSSQEAQDHVSRTNQEFGAKGVTGTPTFFINNRKVMLAGKSLREVVANSLSGATKSN